MDIWSNRFAPKKVVEVSGNFQANLGWWNRSCQKILGDWHLEALRQFWPDLLMSDISECLIIVNHQHPFIWILQQNLIFSGPEIRHQVTRPGRWKPWHLTWRVDRNKNWAANFSNNIGFAKVYFQQWVCSIWQKPGWKAPLTTKKRESLGHSTLQCCLGWLRWDSCGCTRLGPGQGHSLSLSAATF